MESIWTSSKLDKITFKDWFLAVTGLLLTLCGVLSVRNDYKLGITTIAIFGTCFVMSVRVILRKRRNQKQTLEKATVVGGRPILASRARLAKLGIGFLVVGGIIATLQFDDDKVFFGFGLLAAVVGGVILIGLVAGPVSKTYIQFDPPGITFSSASGKTRVPWSAITKVARGEFHSNQAVLLWVDQDSVVVEPPSFLEKQRKQMASSRIWTGADFVIMSSLYGIDALVLLAAISRYVDVPEARKELWPVPSLKT